jgi:signal transduction histidine kinase
MVIRLYLGMLESCLPKTANSKIKETFAVVDRTIEGLRRMIGRLSPLVLQELGLIAAIRKEAKDLGKNAGVKTHVAVSDNVGRLSPETETAIYRVVQEALHNVAKHAQAKNVNIQMDRAEDGSVHLLVEDDGIGFVQRSTRGQSFGLAGMRERIVGLGGAFKVRSSKGKGTRIEVAVPEAPPTTLALPAMADTSYSQRVAVSSGSTAS